MSGDGPIFCAGGDFNEFSAAPDLEAFVLEMATTLAEQLAKRETVVLGETRRLLTEGTNRALRDAMANETSKVAWAAGRPAVRASISAFMNRGSPSGSIVGRHSS